MNNWLYFSIGVLLIYIFVLDTLLLNNFSLGESLLMSFFFIIVTPVAPFILGILFSKKYLRKKIPLDSIFTFRKKSWNIWNVLLQLLWGFSLLYSIRYLFNYDYSFSESVLLDIFGVILLILAAYLGLNGMSAFIYRQN